MRQETRELLEKYSLPDEVVDLIREYASLIEVQQNRIEQAQRRIEELEDQLRRQGF